MFRMMKILRRRRGVKDNKEPAPIPLKKYLELRFELEQLVAKETIIKLNDVENNVKPLFFLHPAEGNSKCFKQLASCLSCPVYGLQVTPEAPLSSVEELAEFYLQHVVSVESEGPYRILGYSSGCAIALEMACMLQRKHPQKPEIVQLIMLDGSHCILNDTGKSFVKAFKASSPKAIAAFGMIFFMNMFIEVDMSEVYKKISDAERDEQKEFAVDMLMKTKKIPCRSDLEGLVDLYRPLCKVIGDHQLSNNYRGDITLVLAKQSFLRGGTKHKDYRLQEVCDGKVNIIEVQGDHQSFLVDENAKRVAKVIMSVFSM